MKHLLWVLPILLMNACTSPEPRTAEEVASNDTLSAVERNDPAIDAIVAANAVPEAIGTGYEWSEGPVWVSSQNMLLFSDVPTNTIYRWTPGGGEPVVYLTPSGYTGSEPSQSREPGSNGLTLDNEGNLILAQHGDRRIARMTAPLDTPGAAFETIAGTYDGKRFNSPNDVVLDRAGNVYFTDPPYGLPRQMDDPTKETPYQGVYKVSPDGQVTLLVDSLTRPNGIALSPDEKYLYVANSDPGKAIWYRYELGDTSVVSGGVFYDATDQTDNLPGLPDGLKVDRNGHIFGTGPGGVFVLSPEGTLLGKIRFEGPTSNVALADDDKTLYVTNDFRVMRVRLRD